MSCLAPRRAQDGSGDTFYLTERAAQSLGAAGTILYLAEKDKDPERLGGHEITPWRVQDQQDDSQLTERIKPGRINQSGADDRQVG
jgi:hypothetical protein